MERRANQFQFRQCCNSGNGCNGWSTFMQLKIFREITKTAIKFYGMDEIGFFFNNYQEND